jgi:phage terminase large subunit
LANNTVDSIKSFEGVDFCWIEEAQSVSERSWEILIPTIRNDSSEIWMSFNPNEFLDPTYQRFIVNTPPDTTVMQINFCDNPWFPEVLRKEKDYLFEVDPEAAAHIWLGECRKVSNAQVLRGRYSVEPFEPRMDLWDGPYQGADWGFANDPTVLVRCWVYERTLYIEKECWEIGTDIDMIPALFDRMPDSRKYMIRADCARPETISYMQRCGFRIQGVNKWAGSIDDGVEHLRSYEKVVIHPSCTHSADNARLYSYKIDRLTGDILPSCVDKHNDCIDSWRYALEPVIRGAIKKQARRRTNSFKPLGRAPNPQAWMS